MKRPLIIAHRGASGSAPENTLSAFREAFICHADLIEFDVQFTLDHQPVVIHDATLKRTAGLSDAVRNRTAEQIQSLDGGGWFDPAFSGEKIPLLAEVLQVVKPQSVDLLIEIKADVEPPPDFADILLEVLFSHRMDSRVILQSMNPALVRKLKARHSALRCGLVIDHATLDLPGETKAAGANLAVIRWNYATPLLVEDARRHKVRVFVWTVNRPAVMRKMALWQVDGIITNYPAEAREILGGG